MRRKNDFMSKRLSILAVCALLALMQAGGLKSYGYTWTVGGDVSASSINNIDAGPAYGRDKDGNLWFVYSDGMPQPLWHVLKGTTADDLVEQYTFNPVVHFGQPNGDDRYWMVGLWIDPATQYWYTTVHIEFDYEQWGRRTGSGDHFRRIDLAVSRDQGRTWTNQGDIITPPTPTVSTVTNYPGPTFSFGDGDQKLYIDKAHGYFYLYYQTATIEKATGHRDVENIMAARAPISRKMAPGSWTKWYNGAWSQPGLTGQESVVVPNCDSFFVCWNTYLHAYLAVANDYAGSFYTCGDLSKGTWKKLGRFAPNGGAGGVEWYNWALDAGSLATEMTTGRSFRVYSAQNHAYGVATKYMLVTLNGGPETPRDPRRQTAERSGSLDTTGRSGGTAFDGPGRERTHTAL